MLRLYNNIFLLCLAASHAAFATDLIPNATVAVATKIIELEWDAVDKAESYEVRLTPELGGVAFLSMALENRLTKEIPLGRYSVEVRAKIKDEDKFSPWSEKIELEVMSKSTLPLRPADGAVITAEGKKNVALEFAWAPVEKVKEYTVRVWSQARKNKPWVFNTSKTQKTLNIPPGEVYYWQVFFDRSDVISYNQNPPIFSFSLQGKQLVRPEITTQVESGKVKVFSWKASPGAGGYTAKLSYRPLDEEQYQLLRKVTLKQPLWPAQSLRAGQYKLEIQAFALKRAPSQIAEFEFVIKPTVDEMQRALNSLAADQP